MSQDRHRPDERSAYAYPTWRRQPRAEAYLQECHGLLRAPMLRDELGAEAVIVTDSHRVIVRPIPGDRERVRVEMVRR